MSDLFVNQDAICDHLAHIVSGVPIREIARNRQVEASTVSRRIQGIEVARDHPDLDAIITAIEAHYDTQDAPGPITRDFVSAALKVTLGEVCQQFQKIAQALVTPKARVLVGEFPQVALSMETQSPVNFSRQIALAGVAFDWLEPVGNSTGKVRQFAATPCLVECAQTPFVDAARSAVQRKKRAGYESPVEQLLRRKGQEFITSAHADMAKMFHEIYVLRYSATMDSYRAIEGALPDRTLQFLVSICGEHAGLEVTEKSLGLPVRSAKAVLPFALEHFAQAMGSA